MKSLLIALSTFLVTLTPIKGQSQWELVNEGIGTYLGSLDFIDAHTGWINGWQCGLLKTRDGGETWGRVNDEFECVDFYNDSIGWAINRIGILRTGDGGETWDFKKWRGDLQGLSVVSESVIFVFGEKSIQRTVDSGSSWENITPGEGHGFGPLSFLNADSGVVVGYVADTLVFFRTFNGGESWFAKPGNEFNEVSQISFHNERTGFFVAHSADNPDAHIYRTPISLRGWTALNSNGYSINGCHFLNDSTLLSVMSDSTTSYMMKSNDGGLSWELSDAMVLSRNHNEPQGWGGYSFISWDSVAYLQDNTRGMLLKSLDEGNSWTLLKLSYPNNDVHITDRGRIFIVGGDLGLHIDWGDILRTDEAFEAFEFIPINTTLRSNGSLKSCHFISEDLGYTLHEREERFPLKTLDGGDRWYEDITFQDISDIHVLNDSIGYAAAKGLLVNLNGPSRSEGWQVVKTTHNEEAWKEMEPAISKGREISILYSLCFVDEKNGWVLARVNQNEKEEAIIIKYTGEQGWSEISPGTNLPLNKIHFFDHKTGWISGGYHNEDDFRPLFLKSMDGGESWESVRMSMLVHDFFFENQYHGWAVGEDMKEQGVILETIDGGITWITVMDSLSGPLNALDFADGLGLAVGENGLIVKTEYTITSSDKQEGPVSEKESELFQNYPNPFTSETRISYQLENYGLVELSVYDISGRSVFTRVLGSREAGRHELIWKAEGMQPGIYFCELRSPDGRQMIKMILVE